MSKPRRLLSDHLTRVFYVDLEREGIVRNRVDLMRQIRAGRLPPPHKDTPGQRGRAWWFSWEIDAAIERERAELEDKNIAAE